jgi:protein-L-isoaspartate O-methyltransferase
MYATVVEALAFEAGQSFLNVGSGTGYLSAVVAHLLGPTGVNHGIDIFPELVELAREAYRAQQQRSESKMCSAQFIAGNCFALNAALNRQYDRIYIGAAAPFASKDFFCDFLRVGGVLVVRDKRSAFPAVHAHSPRVAQAPFDSELLRITRRDKTTLNTQVVTRVQFASLLTNEQANQARQAILLERRMHALNRRRPRGQVSDDEEEDEEEEEEEDANETQRQRQGQGQHRQQQVQQSPPSMPPHGGSASLQGAQSSASASSSSSGPAGPVAPAASPSRAAAPAPAGVAGGLPLAPPAQLFFRELVWSPERHHEFPQRFRKGVRALLALQRRPSGIVGRLPQSLWFEIFEFMDRDWFEPELTEVETLRMLLEQEIRARRLAEERAARAERERDNAISMLLAVRMRMFPREEAQDEAPRT